MNENKANEIYQKIHDEWVNRHGIEKLDKYKLEGIKIFLIHCPDDDGLKRVQSLETGKTHLVPYEDIILNGLKGCDVHKYPEETRTQEEIDAWHQEKFEEMDAEEDFKRWEERHR